MELIASVCENLPDAPDHLAANLLRQSLVNLVHAAGLVLPPGKMTRIIETYESARALLQNTDDELFRAGFTPEEIRALRYAEKMPGVQGDAAVCEELTKPLHTVLPKLLAQIVSEFGKAVRQIPQTGYDEAPWTGDTQMMLADHDGQPAGWTKVVDPEGHLVLAALRTLRAIMNSRSPWPRAVVHAVMDGFEGANTGGGFSATIDHLTRNVERNNGKYPLTRAALQLSAALVGYTAAPRGRVDLHALFDRFDTDGNKSLDRNEFENGLAELGYKLSPSAVDSLFVKFDAGQEDDSIDYDESITRRVMLPTPSTRTPARKPREVAAAWEGAATPSRRSCAGSCRVS